MIYLVLAIFFSTSLNIIFRFSEKIKSNRLALSFFSFLGSTIVSLVFVMNQISFDPDLINSFILGLNGTIGNSAMITIVLGGLNGFVYLGAYYAIQKSTNHNGMAMTVTFNKIGVMVPVILSIIFFSEIPSLWQSLGILISIAAILILNFKKEENNVITSKLILFGTFFLGGFADFTSKIYQVYGIERYQSLFILLTFLSSAIITGIIIIFKARNIKKTDVVLGLIVGIPSQFISTFLLRSLSTLPAFIVFPIFSVGVILLVNMINLTFFKEKLTKVQFSSIGLIICGIILLNV